jgi:hypothetical protein
VNKPENNEKFDYCFLQQIHVFVTAMKKERTKKWRNFSLRCFYISANVFYQESTLEVKSLFSVKKYLK